MADTAVEAAHTTRGFREGTDMPAPYDYRVAQPRVSTYFDAMREGRADRLAVENEQKTNALSKYLPGALQGDKEAQGMALQSAPVDQMAGLKQMFTQMEAPKLAALKDLRAKGASGAAWAKTPEQWATVQATLQAEAQAAGLPFKEVPFEQKDAMAAMGQTVDSLIDQAYKEKTYQLDVSRTNAQNAASYASAAASRAAAGRGAGGGNAPQGYQWTRGADGSVVLAPITGGPADPNRIAPGEGVKVRASNAQLDALEQSLKSYIENLDKTSAFGRVVSRGAEVSKVETGHTDLLMQMKNLYELGVLNGPDYMLMTKIVEDPTSLMQLARGTDGLKAQTDTVKSIIARSRNINNAKLGLPASTTSSPPPPGDYRTEQRNLLNGQGGPARPTLPPPPQAVEHLRANPNLAADFDRKYGPGTAARVLGAQ